MATLAQERRHQRAIHEVILGDQDVDEAMNRLKQGADKAQFLVSEIFIAVDRPEDETTVRASAISIGYPGGHIGAVAPAGENGRTCPTGTNAWAPSSHGAIAAMAWMLTMRPAAKSSAWLR